MHALRERAFSLPANQLGVVPGAGHMRVWSVLMETGYPEAVASLVTIADGSASLYFSNGGGIIGAGEHDGVCAAAEAFMACADENAAGFVPAFEHPLPAVGRVRFYARTFDGLLTTEAAEVDLGENRHPLSPLFHLGHEVIAAVREASPSQ
jgi:hypothetical protein